MLVTGTLSRRQTVILVAELPSIYKSGICIGVVQSFLILNVSSGVWWAPNKK